MMIESHLKQFSKLSREKSKMSNNSAHKIAAIIRDAGGRVVGRTRLQKIAYLLTAAGLEEGLHFAYKHYGPYSEEVAAAARTAHLLGYIVEEERQAEWGGSYSIYSVGQEHTDKSSEPRRRLARMAAEADAVELELAATAVFLSCMGYNDPWLETARRKPEKAENGRIEGAKELLRRIRAIGHPIPFLPVV
jgi:uncharacterized protein YwgA